MVFIESITFLVGGLLVFTLLSIKAVCTVVAVEIVDRRCGSGVCVGRHGDGMLGELGSGVVVVAVVLKGRTTSGQNART